MSIQFQVGPGELEGTTKPENLSFRWRISSVLVNLLSLWRDTMIKATLMKESIYLRLVYSLVHYHHGGKHGSMQAGAREVAESYILICRQSEPVHGTGF